MMDTVFFLILRRMRGPLLLLSAVYTVATLGLTLIPGIDDKGDIWYMDFFHAFYFVSYMGTTTGFGEIPYPFTQGQRMWTLVFIYITVATWIYTLGALISLLSSELLQNAATEYRFSRQVNQINEPFSLVCGYGDSGSKLVSVMRHQLMQVVVVEIKQERIDALQLDDNEIFVPGMRGDASIPDNLVAAGITHPHCRNVVALTDDNAVNLHIAITAKVMNPRVNVICRSDSHEIESNMASFGTDHIIDPYNVFAKDLGLATYAPHQFLLSLWLRGEAGEVLSDVQEVPEGRWIVCGYGRFGQAIVHEMINQDLVVQVIEPNEHIEDLPEGTIVGDGTGAESLEQAGIRDAVGIIAGTDDDSNNLSIIVTAKELNPGLFVIVRQNEHTNRHLFSQSPADVFMEPSGVIARKIRSILTNHTIDEFLSLARARDDLWARALSDRIRALDDHRMPQTWEIVIGTRDTPAVVAALDDGAEMVIGHLLRDYTDDEMNLDVIPLYHSSSLGAFCSPPIHTPLARGDKLLLIGTSMARWKMEWISHNEVSLAYVLTGEIKPQSLIARWLADRAG